MNDGKLPLNDLRNLGGRKNMILWLRGWSCKIIIVTALADEVSLILTSAPNIYNLYINLSEMQKIFKTYEWLVSNRMTLAIGLFWKIFELGRTSEYAYLRSFSFFLFFFYKIILLLWFDCSELQGVPLTNEQFLTNESLGPYVKISNY